MVQNVTTMSRIEMNKKAMITTKAHMAPQLKDAWIKPNRPLTAAVKQIANMKLKRPLNS